MEKESEPVSNETKWQPDRRTFLKVAVAGAGLTSELAHAEARHGVPVPNEFPDLAQLRHAHGKAGIIPPDKTYRMMEWSLHFPPQAKFDFDLEGAMKMTREVGSESVLFYAQDHWGYAHYPSDVGVRHPNLTFDFFGKQVELARQNGMSSVAYYSLQANNQIIMKHPDWGWVDEKGEPMPGRWGTPCLDTPYRQYALGMIEEVCSRYQVGELFIDIFGIQFYRYHSRGDNPFCFCKYTEDAWNREHPGDDYRQGFGSREGWERRYHWHQQRSMVDMLDEITAAARKHNPKLIIALNGGPEVFPDEIQRRVGFLYAEPLPSVSGIALGSIILRGWGRPDYQAGIFTMAPYFDSLPEAPFRVQADALLVQNSRVFFVGETPLVSNADGVNYSVRWFDRAREAFADVRNVDCLLAGLQPVLSSAALYSQPTMQEMAAQKRPRDFRYSILGALENLTYSGRPVESLPEFRLTPELLNKLDTFVLPEVDCLSDAHAAMIAQWVREGGTLVASYKCGLKDEKHRARKNFPLADALGVNYESEERRFAYAGDDAPRPTSITTYLESSGHPLAAMFGKKTVGLPGSFLHVKPTTAQEVMRYRLPFMVEDIPHQQWYNWGAPPPGAETAGPAVTRNKFGKGQAIYIGAPIFWAMKDRPYWIRQWVPNLLRQLVPNPLMELRLEPHSEYVHGTFFYDRTGQYVLVQVLNTIEIVTRGEYRDAPRLSLAVNSSKLKIAEARMVWPKTLDLPLMAGAGKTHINLPKLDRYMALFLRLA
jgi:hypothetical protein